MIIYDNILFWYRYILFSALFWPFIFETLALGLGTTIGMFSGMGILPSRQAWLAGKYTEKRTEAWKKWMFIAGNTGRNGCLVRWKNHLQLDFPAGNV